MSRKSKLVLLILATLISVSFVVIKTSKHPGYKKGVSFEGDTAVREAGQLYKRVVATGADLSQGPCISNDLMKGWVVDIVHTPRESIDDLPENQCAAFREGRARHFVELDQSGNLVRVY